VHRFGLAGALRLGGRTGRGILSCALQLNKVFLLAPLKARELRSAEDGEGREGQEKEALEHGEARTESVGDRNTPEITMTMDDRRLRSGPCKADRLSTR